MGIFRRFEFLESWFILHGKIRAYAVARMITVLAFICVRIGLLFFDASLQLFLLVLPAETALVDLMSLIAYLFPSRFRFHCICYRSVAFLFLLFFWSILPPDLPPLFFFFLN